MAEKTKDELNKMFTDWAHDVGLPIVPISKDIVSLETANFGELMPRESVMAIINLAVKRNEWLSAIDVQTVSGSKGTVPILDPYDANFQPVGENDPQGGYNTQPTRRVNYSTQEAKAMIYVTYKDLREAAHAGLSDFEQKLYENFSTGLGNSLGNCVYNGDTDLPATNWINKMLRMKDGIRKQCVARANVYDGAGAKFTPSIFYKLEELMPDDYAEQPNLTFMYPRRIDSRLREAITNFAASGGSQGSALGDQAFITMNALTPLGKRPIINPNISSRQGPTPIAPTSAAGSGSGIVFDLTTLVTAEYVATAAAGAGRKYKVVHVPSGKSETVVGVDSTGLKITTTGTLGQTIVSTVAADYLVTLADETDLLYTNPKNITLVLNGEWRWYTQFNPNFNRWETFVYIDFDTLLAIPELMVMINRVWVESAEWPPTAA